MVCTQDSFPVHAPDLVRLISEPRAAFELAQFHRKRNRLLYRTTQGRVIICLPGAFGHDWTSALLRYSFEQQGHHTYGWQQGLNLGPRERKIQAVIDRVHALSDAYGKPITLIGHSMGGVYARHVARVAADDTAEVYLLGAPFRWNLRDRLIYSPFVQALASLCGGRMAREILAPEEDKPPLTKKSVAFFVQGDPFMRPPECIEDDGPNRLNIEVTGTHAGMFWNLSVGYALTQLLAQPVEDAPRFVPSHKAQRYFPQNQTLGRELTLTIAR